VRVLPSSEDHLKYKETPMARFTSPLKNLKVAAPCPADWDEMYAFEGERVRYCSGCRLNVYNLSAMSRGEAEALIARAEGRLCVRFYRRADGSVLTQNCPVGLRAVKARVSRAAQIVCGTVLGLLANVGFLGFKEVFLARPYGPVMGAIVPAERLSGEQFKILRAGMPGEILMGRTALPVDGDKASGRTAKRQRPPAQTRQAQPKKKAEP
jgi:hypothetical protein